MSDRSEDSIEVKVQPRAENTDKIDPLYVAPPSRSDPEFKAKIPNTLLSIAFIAFGLGSIFSWGLTVFLSGGFTPWWATYQLGFFLAAWATFHFWEFGTTAGWNRDRCTVDSFLLQNGSMYHIAHGTALFEYLLTLYFKPSWKIWHNVTIVGIVMVVLFQVLRSMAMITAASNFNHSVQFEKSKTHKLVTTGVYSWFRHPSYTGFFYWALGTQLVLQNPVTFVVYFILLWRFFSQRIRYEERALIRFFGDDYKEYRKRVGTMIPFIP